MRFLYAKLTGYIGFYNGLGLEEVEIDFSKAKHNICVISGPNGVGKSTLVNSFTILPDSNENFVPNMDASKYITLQNEGSIYSINITHKLEKNGSRTTKAYISKNGEELNVNGSVTQYKDIIFSEFDIDGNYISMAKVSSENRGIADKRPGERKKLISERIKSLETYNDIYKSLNKRANTFKSQLNALSSKIQSIGSREALEQELVSINRAEAAIAGNIEEHKQALIEAQTKIKLLDPDGSIERNHEKLSLLRDNNARQLDEVIKQIRRIDDTNYSEEVILKSYDSRRSTIAYDIEKAETDLNKAQYEKDKNDIQLSMYQDRIGEITKKISHIDAELYSLGQSESLKQYPTIVKAMEEKEAMLRVIEQDYANNMFYTLKDSVGIDVIKTVIRIINTMEQGYHNLKEVATEKAIEVVEKNKGVGFVWLDSWIEGNRKDKEKALSILTESQKDLAAVESKYEVLKLEIRDINYEIPDKCKLSKTCPLAIKYQSNIDAFNELDYEIEKLAKRIDEQTKNITGCEREEKEYEEYAQLIQAIKSMNQFVLTNRNILQIFFEPQVANMLDNNESPEIYLTECRYIINVKETIQDFHNFMVDYIRLNTEIRVLRDTAMRDKGNMDNLNRCTEEKNILQEDLERIKKEIVRLKQDVNFSVAIIDKKASYIAKQKELLSHIEKLEQIVKERDRIASEISKNKENADEVTYLSDKILKSKEVIEEGMVKLDNIGVSKNAVNSKLLLLDTFSIEYDEYKEKYDFVNTLRKYSSPTQGSIQTLYMSMYMNKTLDLTNQLLGMLFEGRYRLLDYIINENEFRIPFLGDGLTVDDVSSGSTSQKCIMGSIINLVLFSSSSSIYNIASMDEVDGGLDHVNRLLFVDVVQKIIEILKIDQLFLISHSIEASLNNIDVILLSDDPTYVNQFANANIIYQYTRR